MLPGRVGDARPDARRRRRRSSAPTAGRSTALSAAPRRSRTARSSTLPPGLAQGEDRARLARHLHLRRRRPSARAPAGAIGLILVDNRSGEANAIPIQLAAPGRDDHRPRRPAARARIVASNGGADASASRAASRRSPTGRGGVDHELLVRRPDGLRPRSQARRLGARAGRSSPRRRRRRPARRSPSSTERAWRRRTSPAPPRCSSSGIRAGRRGRSSRRSCRPPGPAWADTARTRRRPVLLEGGGLVERPARRRPEGLHRPAVALVRRSEREPTARGARALLLAVSDAGDGAGTWQVELAPQSPTPGASLDVPGTVTLRRRAATPSLPVVVARRRQTRGRRQLRLRRPAAAARSSARVPYYFAVDAAAARSSARRR